MIAKRPEMTSVIGAAIDFSPVSSLLWLLTNIQVDVLKMNLMYQCGDQSGPQAVVGSNLGVKPIILPQAQTVISNPSPVVVVNNVEDGETETETEIFCFQIVATAQTSAGDGLTAVAPSSSRRSWRNSVPRAAATVHPDPSWPKPSPILYPTWPSANLQASFHPPDDKVLVINIHSNILYDHFTNTGKRFCVCGWREEITSRKR